MIKPPLLDVVETQAIAILGFLVSEPERLGRFIALTGVDPSDIRTLMQDEGFWRAIFDHLFDDESLLMAYCAEAQLQPMQLVKMRQRLSRPQDEGLREG